MWTIDGQKNASNKESKVSFRNLTDWDVIVLLPEGLQVDEPGSFTLQKNGSRNKADRVEKTIVLRAAGPGEQHRYSVVVVTDAGPVAATGDSDPIIIVDPPPA